MSIKGEYLYRLKRSTGRPVAYFKYKGWFKIIHYYLHDGDRCRSDVCRQNCFDESTCSNLEDGVSFKIVPVENTDKFLLKTHPNQHIFVDR